MFESFLVCDWKMKSEWNYLISFYFEDGLVVEGVRGIIFIDFSVLGCVLLIIFILNLYD